jgi:hypothetical protein
MTKREQKLVIISVRLVSEDDVRAVSVISLSVSALELGRRKNGSTYFLNRIISFFRISADIVDIPQR